MYRDAFAMEHYRMHVMEQWPDSPRKEAGLAAVRSTLESLRTDAPGGELDFVCSECLSTRSRTNLIQFPAPAVHVPSRRWAA
jgi:hypothetical protein